MRTIVISIVSAIILVVLAILLLPMFLSTDYLKAQVVNLVKDQTGMTLAIDGDVSLSFITGVKLNTESVSLRDQQDQPLFSVRNLDFALALSPLLNGRADITGITLDQPIVTIVKGAETTAQTTAQTGTPASINGTNGAAETATTEPTSQIDLSALSIRRLTINDAQLVTIDAGGHTSNLITGLNATIQIPDFNGSSEIEASLPYMGRSLSIQATIANTGRAINGQASRIDISLDGELLKAKVVGDIALKGDTLLTANYAANIGNVTQFMSWLELPADLIDVKAATLEGSVLARSNEVRLPSLALTMDKQKLSAAARYFTNKNQRPVMRIAVDSSTFNLDEILKPVAKNTASTKAGTPAKAAAEATQPDLSILNDFNASLDFRSGRLTYQGQSLNKVKLLAQIINGKLGINLKSANLAKGNVSAKLSGDIGKLVWSGNLTANALDIKELAQLAGQQSPLGGIVSANLNFAAQGLNADDIVKKGNIAGDIALKNGQFSDAALQKAIPNRKDWRNQEHHQPYQDCQSG